MGRRREPGLIVGRLRSYVRPLQGAAIFVHSRLDRLVAYRDDGDLVDLERFWRLEQGGVVGDGPLHNGTRFVRTPGPYQTSASASAQTSDATVTTCGTVTLTDGKVTLVSGRVVARKSDGTKGAGYLLEAAYRRAGGTVTLIGAVLADATFEDDATWDCTFDISGTTVRIRVTGAAAETIDWVSRLATLAAP